MIACIVLTLTHPFALVGLLMKGSSKKKISDPTIAIVHAEGVIMSGKSGQSLFGGKTVGSSTLVKTFDEIAKNDKIKAVVFRIDSPGGSALASEMILQAVRRCAKKKPVIISQGAVAGSGGYWISMYSDKIVASPLTITG